MRVRVRRAPPPVLRARVRARVQAPVRAGAGAGAGVRVAIFQRPVQSCPNWKGEMFVEGLLRKTGPSEFEVKGAGCWIKGIRVSEKALSFWGREGLTLSPGGGVSLFRHINPRELFRVLKKVGLWR